MKNNISLRKLFLYNTNNLYDDNYQNIFDKNCIKDLFCLCQIILIHLFIV